MASPHTFIARFKPHAFGHHFDLYADGLYWCGPSPANIAAGNPTGGGHGKGKGTKKALTGVTCTIGTGNKTVEVKNGVTWTHGVIKVGPSKAAKLAVFKAQVDAAVAAYVA